MAVSAFLLSLSCTLAPAQPGVVEHDQCDKFELQRFDNATLEEIQGCADMGEALQLMGRQAWCEVVPMADAQPANFRPSAAPILPLQF